MRKGEVRQELYKMMPEMPLEDREEILDETMEAVEKYGAIRLITMGEVAVRMVKSDLARNVGVKTSHDKPD